VRDLPDLRTVRYYTTLGLLDRPAAMRGRTALYGRRHVLQLVAIKRLQARGLSLAQVQERLVGLSDSALRRLADSEAAAPRVARSSASPASSSRAESFWRVDAELDQGRSSRESADAQHVGLDQGLVLALETTRELDDEDMRVIRMAAAPLIEILRLRGLIDAGPAEPRKGQAR
jgi:DNA-binding transcriptional MerR regulator